VVVAIEGNGTSDTQWREWTDVRCWPAIAPATAAGAVVVAPHPDDEILGAGGLMALAGTGTVVAVTDGDASHPDATPEQREHLRRVRPEETTEAIGRLGLHCEVLRLGQGDGHIVEEPLTEALVGLLRPGQICLATWRGDGHPDHEAVGRAAAAACEITGAILWEYPIWMWHWAEPRDPRVPWTRARRIDLPEPTRRAKSHAIEAFTSQITPMNGQTILPPHVLERFRRPWEVMFT